MKEQLTAILNEEILPEYPAIFLVDLVILQKGDRRRVLIILDGDTGVPIDTCAEVSRRLGHLVEERALTEEAYILEVSSPGIDQPLKLKRQYAANIGRTLKIEAANGETFTGTLLSVNDDAIVIAPDAPKKSKRQLAKEAKEAKNAESAPEAQPATRPVAFEDIKRAMVQISFS